MARKGTPITLVPASKRKSDFTEYMKQQDEAFSKLMEVSNKATIENPKGFIYKWQVADSYAYYLVSSIKPLTLRYIDYCDGWQAPRGAVRGLTLADVQHSIRFNNLFSGILR